MSNCPLCKETILECKCLLTDQFYTDQNKQAGALDIQVGGAHYKDMKIQPLEFTMANNLDFIQGNVVKYICRHKNKNGVEDLKKVIHYAQLAAKMQYGVDL